MSQAADERIAFDIGDNHAVHAANRALSTATDLRKLQLTEHLRLNFDSARPLIPGLIKSRGLDADLLPHAQRGFAERATDILKDAALGKFSPP